MKLHIPLFTAIALAVTLFMFPPAQAANPAGLYFSPHNFSASRQAGNPIYGSSEPRLCVFCHAPHHANGEGALWNRDLSNQENYRMYESSTMTAVISPKPTGASRLCLSCHDGTIAVGTLAGGNILTQAPAVRGSAQLALMNNGKNDLSADHPISFTYPTKADLANPEALPSQIKLAPGNRVECTACHNPHSNEFGKFLVMNNSDGTVICTSCHLVPGWVTPPFAIHKTGIVENNQGCGNCHQPHKAPGARNLLKGGGEEKNCTTTCHAAVATAFGSSYSHPISSNDNVHNVNGVESLPMEQKHIKCADCHSPHQATNLAAPPASPGYPLPRTVNGPLAGVRGFSALGSTVTPAQYEYEICFRCHTGQFSSSFVGQYGAHPSLPIRLVSNPDERLRFATSNRSFHPVIGQTNQLVTGFAVRSLLLPSAGTIISCSDCHSRHGSQYPHILKAQYDTFSEPYLRTNYDLCYSCHNETFINDRMSSGFPSHVSHLNPAAPGRLPVPCSGCHDPHGVATSPNLINFDTKLLPFAADLPPAVQSYLSTGPGHGTCTVSCHSSGVPNKYTHSY
jgi:predicted CXXCH cytochrome family protein